MNKFDLDEEPRAQDLTSIEILTTGLALEWNQSTINCMADAIQDAADGEQLARASSVVLGHLVSTFGGRAFPDTRLNKTFLKTVAGAFRDRVDTIAEGGSAKAQLLKQTADAVFDSMHEELRDYGRLYVSPNAARIAFQLLNSMFGPYAREIKEADLNLTQNTELAALILVHFLLAGDHVRFEHINRECQDLVFGLLYETLGISQPNYKAYLRSDLAPGRLVLLGYCLTKGHGDAQSITDELLSQLESTVLNDKQPSAVAEGRAAYFQTFLAAVGQEVVEGKILPQIEFTMNRTKSFLRVIARVLQGLRAYQIEDLETLQKWTAKLVTDDFLMEGSSELGADLVLYLKAVHGMCSEAHDMKRALIVDVLVDKFKQTKRGQAHFKAKAREALLRQIYALVNAEGEKDRHVSHDLLQVVLDHFLQTKEEAEVADIAQIVYKFVSLALPQDTMDLLMPLLEEQPRVQFPQQIQVILEQMRGNADLARLSQLENVVSDQLLASLLAANFKSVQNSTSILALSAFFALKATKLKNVAGASVLVANEQVAQYLLSPAGFVNSLAFIEAKGKTLQDTQNHLHVIEALLRYHFTVAQLQPAQFSCLLNTLCELLLNLNCVFRESAVLTCFESLRDLGSQLTIPLFKAMFEKISEVSSRPAPRLAEGEFALEQGLKVSKKIQLVVKMLYDAPGDSQQPKRVALLEKQEFFLLLRTICHPFVSAQSKDLMSTLRCLTDIMDKQAALNGDNRELTLPSYFQKYFDEIVQYALVQRTGILSPNATLREIAKNMLICLGWQGYLGDFIGKLVAILDYRPVELAV